MNLNNLKITELPKPVKGIFVFKPEMAAHPELGCLRYFQNRGKIPVEVFGFSKTSNGRLLHFYPTGLPSIRRCALSEFFDPTLLKNLPP